MFYCKNEELISEFRLFSCFEHSRERLLEADWMHVFLVCPSIYPVLLWENAQIIQLHCIVLLPIWCSSHLGSHINLCYHSLWLSGWQSSWQLHGLMGFRWFNGPSPIPHISIWYNTSILEAHQLEFTLITLWPSVWEPCPHGPFLQCYHCLFHLSLCSSHGQAPL